MIRTAATGPTLAQRATASAHSCVCVCGNADSLAGASLAVWQSIRSLARSRRCKRASKPSQFVCVSVSASVRPSLSVRQWSVTSRHVVSEANTRRDHQPTTNASRACIGCGSRAARRSLQVCCGLMHLLSRYTSSICCIRRASRPDVSQL